MRPTVLLCSGLILVQLTATGCQAFNIDAEMKEGVQRAAAAFELQTRQLQVVVPIDQPVVGLGGERLLVERVGSTVDGLATPATNRLMAIDLSIENPAATVVVFDPTKDLWVTDADGRRYLPVRIDGLEKGDIASGQTVRGRLVFVVNTAATGLRLTWQYHPSTAIRLP